ncbi:hypothetical protein [Xanthobacter sp. 91]|uniref:hypothetical protein n=1 Tax=Xanthobacter sp. 91 TaxID=1117244 RepID=UPI001AEBF0A3|nr:hypothetical protein [Xanthobacter sp. 91]
MCFATGLIGGEKMKSSTIWALGGLVGAVTGILTGCGIFAISSRSDVAINFAGSILGGTVGGVFTAGAGWLALMSVQIQIREMKRITNLEFIEREAEKSASEALVAEGLFVWISDCIKDVELHEFPKLYVNIFSSLRERGGSTKDLPQAVKRAFPGIDPILAATLVEKLSILRAANNPEGYDPATAPGVDYLNWQAIRQQQSFDEISDFPRIVQAYINDARGTISIFEQYRANVIRDVRLYIAREPR